MKKNYNIHRLRFIQKFKETVFIRLIDDCHYRIIEPALDAIQTIQSAKRFTNNQHFWKTKNVESKIAKGDFNFEFRDGYFQKQAGNHPNQ